MIEVLENLNIIDLNEYSDMMKSYYLIHRIYDIFNYFNELEEDKSIEYNIIETNYNLLFNYISDINFIYLSGIKSLDKIEETTKVGHLLNLQLYLNPKLEDVIIFYDKERINKHELIVLDKK